MKNKKSRCPGKIYYVHPIVLYCKYKNSFHWLTAKIKRKKNTALGVGLIKLCLSFDY